MKTVKQRISFYTLPFLFFISFLLFCISLRVFLAGHIRLNEDAVVYYDHFKYFVDQLLRGIYPLWDPTWQNGIPNEFYLRRIGSHNPFYFIILLLRKVGFPHRFSYFFFLTFYYFLGMIGFYLFAKKVFRDTKSAFVAYMLLMYSTLVSLLFNSFIVLIFTPMIWFFYFLLAFSEDQQKVFCFGMTFCLMILISTYIPFYFITILLLFLMLFALLYPRYLKTYLTKYYNFAKKHKIFVSVCLIFLIIAAVPGVLFYQESAQGEFVLPKRHAMAEFENPIIVATQTTAKGGIYAVNFFNNFFSNLKDIHQGVVYIPIFVHLLFLLGVCIKINKRLILFCLMGFILYVVGVYGASPVYKFLYQHIWYFKFFRNFQFFLWLVLLPSYILICVGHFRAFLDFTPKNVRDRNKRLLTVIILHGIFTIFLTTRTDVLFTSYLTILLSLIFFVYFLLKSFQFQRETSINKTDHFKAKILIFLFFVIIIQPLEILHYLVKNSERKENIYRYEIDYVKPYSIDAEKLVAIRDQQKQNANIIPLLEKRRPDFYMAVKQYALLRRSLNLDVLLQYYIVRGKFVAYDQIEWVDRNNLDLQKIAKAFVNNDNVAFVSTREVNPDVALGEYSELVAGEAFNITTGSKQLEIIHYDVNTVEVITNFKKRKFLVYNDTYYPGWYAYIDGNKTDLFEANVAFKGLWVPEGRHAVLFRFANNGRYIMNYLLMSFFGCALIYLLFLGGIFFNKNHL